MGMETTGKLHTIFETKQVSERFSKREFVLEMADNPKYPQVVLFQLTGDRCAQLDGLKVGDQVSIEFSLRGREWRSPSGDVKYFNSLDVWKVVPMRADAEYRNGDRDYRGGGDRDYRGGGDRDYRGGGDRGGGGPDRRASRPSGDPRDELNVPRDYDYRPGAEPSNDDIPF